MNPALGMLPGILIGLGILGVIVGMRPAPEKKPGPPAAGSVSLIKRVPRAVLLRAVVGVVLGLVIVTVTGWALALLLVPAVTVGVPFLLARPPAQARMDKLQAMREWCQALAGVLTSGVGLEQAIMQTLRSTPEEIRPEVGKLVARLKARWSIDDALTAFGHDLDDATGDLIVVTLKLGASKRGAGLADVLETLAVTVAEDVKARQQVESDRQGPRSAARIVVIVVLVALGVMALLGDFLQPYTTPGGQVVLAVLLAAFGALLVWLRQIAAGKPTPRFMGVESGARS